MANLSFHMEGVDDAAIEASTGRPDPLPAGTYQLQPEEFELAQTKDGTGIVVKATFGVVTGQCEGRKVFSQYNIRNKSAQAQAIAIGEFKALCLGCGVDYDVAKQDTDHLLFKPFTALVGMEKQNMNQTTGELYAPRNKISKYIPHGEQGAAAPAIASTPKPAFIPNAGAAPSAQKPSGGLPWQKSAGDEIPF
jgi:Protein of unknown function (DUF669)